MRFCRSVRFNFYKKYPQWMWGALSRVPSSARLFPVLSYILQKESRLPSYVRQQLMPSSSGRWRRSGSIFQSSFSRKKMDVRRWFRFFHREKFSGRRFSSVELQLSTVLFRSGVMSTVDAARQAVVHGRIFLNGSLVRFPSTLLHGGDCISVSSKIIFCNFDYPSNFIEVSLLLNRLVIYRVDGVSHESVGFDYS